MRHALSAVLIAILAVVNLLTLGQTHPAPLSPSYGHLAPNVTIVWTDDPTVNCGADPRISPTGKGGCYRHDTPHTIYVSPGMAHKTTEYIILHEYAHTLGLDECEADRYAVENHPAGTLTLEETTYHQNGYCNG